MYLNLNHHLNFTADQEMVAFFLMGISIGGDVAWTLINNIRK
jgi:hypothetical protein